ncbi:MAG: GerMN domain-containing protein [Acidimicrobiales bacterium]|nr:GerMN domain-containing protein [Acidimicrobiales bacterium]
MTGRRLATGAAALVFAGLAVAACGLPSDDTAHSISPDAVPFDLLAPSSTTVADAPDGADTEVVNLFFQNNERLLAVPAEVPRDPDSSAFDPQAAVSELLEGTTGLGVPSGVRSAIPSGTDLLGAQTSGSTVTLNFSEELSSVESNGLVFAIAQIVYTAADITTDRPDGTYQVVIQIDGETITVPDDEGVELDRPVRPSDYPTLRPVTTRVAG